MKLLLLLAVLFMLGSQVFASKTMAELNPEFENYIRQAMKPKNEEGTIYQGRTIPLSLFHFSDIHGDETELKRYTEFLQKYKKYFDDAVCTGDLIPGNYYDDFSFWGKVKGAEKILMTIGNHDLLKDKNWDWSKKPTDQETFDRYFAPFIKNWDVKYEEGKTYYYKDYPEKRFRIIALNCGLVGDDEIAQFNWFEKLITDALVKDLAVVILYHYPLRDMVNIKCNWTDPDKYEVGWTDDINKYQDTLDKFIENGGDFVCWLGGHTHWELVGYSKNHPNQLCICIDAASRWQAEVYDDIFRYDGTRSQDLANAFVADRYSNTIKLIRIGANMSCYMIPRNVFCINYKTFEIISQY